MAHKNPITDCYTEKISYEWIRLIQDPFHRLEFDTTMMFLKRYLPRKGLILDAGGGPGRYTIELAKKGYDLELVDLTPANIEFAKRMIRKFGVAGRVKGAAVANITDLSRFEDNTFDAVLCLSGPVSHIEGKSNREKAISELRRVAKRGAPIFISVFGKMGSLLLSLQEWPDEIKLPGFERFVSTGEDHRWWGKYYAHFFMPEEFYSFLNENKLRVLQLVGLEGIGMDKNNVNLFAKRDKKGWKKFVAAHDKLATHPASVGMSVHILAVCKKA